MKIFRGFDNLPTFRHPVVTVGSYDGVHRGHRGLIDRLVAEAQAIGGESIVVTFEPHPRIALGKAEGLQLLTTLDEKAALLEALGVDNLVIAPFDRQFAALSGAAFADEYLCKKLGAEVLIAGYNHRFGHDRTDGTTLNNSRLRVIRVEACEIEGIRVSSTIIRQLLEAGDTATAERLAGHPLSLDSHKREEP